MQERVARKGVCIEDGGEGRGGAVGPTFPYSEVPESQIISDNVTLIPEWGDKMVVLGVFFIIDYGSKGVENFICKTAYFSIKRNFWYPILIN